jgi:NADH dehydrogenase
MKRVVVTGATGHIGCRFVKKALARDWEICACSRRQPDSARVEWIPYDLASPPHSDDFVCATALVHLAANTAVCSSADEELELGAARRLLEIARTRDIKFVFVSSQTARANAPTAYGRTKWRIEREVLAAGGWVVRPGQVYGGEARGLFGTLVRLVRSLPVLPAFLPSPMVQPIHVDDLAEGLLRIAERDDVPPGCYSLGAVDPVPFSTFLGAIAEGRLRRRRLFVPAPLRIVLPVLTLVGRALPSVIDAGRLRSLVELPPLDTANDLRTLSLSLRPLVPGMHPSGDDRRRRLLLEGRTLLAYVLRHPPSLAMLRRYARAIETTRGGQPLNLPDALHRYPVALALVDSQYLLCTPGAGELDWRLKAAMLLAEASPAGSHRFLGLGERTNPCLAAVRIGAGVVTETFWRILRTLIARVLCRALRRVGG